MLSGYLKKAYLMKSKACCFTCTTSLHSDLNSSNITDMHKRYYRGEVSATLVVAITLGVLFVVSSVFGAFTFARKQDLQTSVDKKIAEAVEVAKKQEASKKELEFAEKEKQPTRQFQGDPTYGQITFSYPKTWSGLTNPSASTPVNATFHPILIPSSGVSDSFSYALKVRVTNQNYDKTLESYKSSIKSGKLTAMPYRAKLVPSILGTRLDGEVDSRKVGSMVILPLRDKTIFIYSESKEFASDFDNIVLESLTFVP